MSAPPPRQGVFCSVQKDQGQEEEGQRNGGPSQEEGPAATVRRVAGAQSSATSCGVWRQMAAPRGSRKTQMQPQQEGHDQNSEPWKERCEGRGQGSGPERGCRGKRGQETQPQMLNVLLSGGDTSEVIHPLWATCPRRPDVSERTSDDAARFLIHVSSCHS